VGCVSGAYQEEEREGYREVVFSNTVQSLRVVLEAMKTLGISLGDPSNRDRANFIARHSCQFVDELLDPDITDAVLYLWRDSGVKQAVTRSREYQLNDSAS
jgi:guanine nucleotide-binding protein G(i) subunit alpha